jgi:hypothetical protein
LARLIEVIRHPKVIAERFDRLQLDALAQLIRKHF